MTPAASNALGTYLRARREQARPEAAGVPDQRNRCVPGLRCEEVAFLAGVSSDYYVRLEQGRDKNPSDHVLLAIARALQPPVHPSGRTGSDVTNKPYYRRGRIAVTVF